VRAGVVEAEGEGLLEEGDEKLAFEAVGGESVEIDDAVL
jgi:hypothetical protein